jgi:tyrosine-specific transport protein
MDRERAQFWTATASLVGAIIGVGVFGLPYALAQVGVGLGLLYFLALGGIQVLQHLFYAEAAIASDTPLRLVGLVERYLGPRAKHVASVATVLGFWGGMLAYIIVGGMFLHGLLAPLLGGSVFAYQVGWALAGAGIVYFGLNIVARVDLIATVGLIGALLLILGLSAPHVEPAHLPWYVGKDLFLPYGVILFSLSGLPVIPEMEDIFQGRHGQYRRSIVLGTLVAAALTALFGFVVWGLTGEATTSDAVVGITSVLGPGIGVVVGVFGFLAIATSFFPTALSLQSTFEYDYKLPHSIAWFLTGGVPFAVFLLGITDFVQIISFSGAVFGGITAVLVALLYIAVTKQGAVKETKLGVPLWIAYVSIGVLVLGAAYETWIAAGHLF